MSHNDSNASFDSTASSARTLDSDEEEEPYDEVELHKEGFKERYYQVCTRTVGGARLHL
jgi:hypothetical protein